MIWLILPALYAVNISVDVSIVSSFLYCSPDLGIGTLAFPSVQSRAKDYRIEWLENNKVHSP
jgi:hypothetical protein